MYIYINICLFINTHTNAHPRTPGSAVACQVGESVGELCAEESVPKGLEARSPEGHAGAPNKDAVCVYTYIYIHIYICRYAYIHTYMCTCIYVYVIGICLYKNKNTRVTNIHIYIHTFTHTFMYPYIFVQLCSYVYMFVFLHVDIPDSPDDFRTSKRFRDPKGPKDSPQEVLEGGA